MAPGNRVPNQLSVLIVDEDPFFCEVLERLLKSKGFTVFRAHCPAEAQLALGQKIDLLFVDYRLRGMDGLTWIAGLRSAGSTLPIVYCSASGFDAARFVLLRSVLRLSLVLAKPIDTPTLKLHLEQLIARLWPGGQVLRESVW